MSKHRDNRAFMSWTACTPLSGLALSVKPALVLSPDGGQLLWANPAGAQRLGTQDLETLLNEEFPLNFPLRKQIRHLFNWLHNDKEQIQRLRLGRSASTPLEMVTVSRLRNVDGVVGVLLRPVADAVSQGFQQRADRLADWLGSGHHYAALFSNSGDVIASSGAFHELRQAADALQELLEEAEDSVLPVSQQVTLQSGTRHLITALKLPLESDDVFLLLVDADEAPVNVSDNASRGVQTIRPNDAGRQSGSPTGRLAASEITVPKPANDTTPQKAKAADKRSERPSGQVSSADRAQKPVEAELMRFVWRMDDAFKFTFVSPEFQTLVGLRGAFEGRTWQDISGDFQLDPDGEVQTAITSKDSWGGKHINWAMPKRKKVAAIELSAMPVFDTDKQFQGYRGFGACQLLDAVPVEDQPPVQDNQVELQDDYPQDDPAADVFDDGEPVLAEFEQVHSITTEAVSSEPTSSGSELSQSEDDQRDEADELPAIIDTRPPVKSEPAKSEPVNTGHIKGLTPEERRAFEEIGKSLSKQPANVSGAAETSPSNLEPLKAADAVFQPVDQATTAQDANADQVQAVDVQADEPQKSVSESALRAILDRVGTGILVVRDDQVLYANRSLAQMVGYETAQAYLAEDAARGTGGFSLDRVGDDGMMELTGKDQTSHKVRASIGRIDWSGQSASLLTVDPVGQMASLTTLPAEAGDRSWNADELLAILNTATEGVLMIDVEGKILALNHGAEALFDEDQASLVGRDLTTLLAPESHKPARDYLAGITGAGVASILNDGREIIGQTAKGGYMPLFMTMGRVGEGNPNDLTDRRLCVVLRDITQWKRAEDDLIAARHNAEKANTAKSDFLAKISHEIRTPLNAILGFSEVMMEERFGPIGNPRYKDYINDIHTSGAHVINLVNDMLDISKIEAGQLELSFTAVDLVAVLKECVALMQPQANEGRVIIRTSFSDDLPRIVADAKTVRQIALNLLSNSIKFTAEGGQVIVSAVVEKDGSLILRVRDTGVGMSETDLAKAMEPFRQIEQTDDQSGSGSQTRSTTGTGLGLPLTKALVEANRAQFLIESTPAKGTLIRVIFPNTRVLAE